MPKMSYGETVERRVKYLLEVLLDYVERCQYEDRDLGIKFCVEEDGHRLRFETNVAALTRLTGKKLTPDQVREALSHYLKEHLGILQDERLIKKGSEDWKFSLRLWAKCGEKDENLVKFSEEWHKKRSEPSKKAIAKSEVISSSSSQPVTTSIKNTIISKSESYIALDHGIPFYKHQNIKLNKTNTKLIISIPERYQRILNPDTCSFEIRKQEISFWHDKLIKSFKYFNIDNYEKLISKAADQAAEEFINDINKGFHRFNSEIFGVERIRPSRIGENEEPSLAIDFYTTDYFTHRVFANIYQCIINNEIQQKLAKIKIPDLREHHKKNDPIVMRV